MYHLELMLLYLLNLQLVVDKYSQLFKLRLGIVEVHHQVNRNIYFNIFPNVILFVFRNHGVILFRQLTGHLPLLHIVVNDSNLLMLEVVVSVLSFVHR